MITNSIIIMVVVFFADCRFLLEGFGHNVVYDAFALPANDNNDGTVEPGQRRPPIIIVLYKVHSKSQSFLSSSHTLTLTLTLTLTHTHPYKQKNK